MAFALDGSRKMHDPYASVGDSSGGLAERLSRLMLAAAAEETKKPPTAEIPGAPAQAETAANHEFPDEDEHIPDWYAKYPWRPSVVERGPTPPTTKSAVWTAVDGVFDKNRRIPTIPWHAIRDMSFFLGKLLRHENSAYLAPVTRVDDRSSSAEIAFNVAV